jgi:hypothetical protein
MDLEYKGANCVIISGKKCTFVTDPKISDNGLKDQGIQATAQLLTQSVFGTKAGDDTLVIDGPGEYEVSNCSIRGIAARRHSELDENAQNATVYRLDLDGISAVVLGHIAPLLSDEQLEELGVVDVLVIPVGDNGYTLDTKSAVSLVRKIEPKIVIPTHYAEDGVTYEVPQQTADDFIKELGVSTEETPKLKLKSGMLPASLTVYKLTLSK